jgi:hypothetical protein
MNSTGARHMAYERTILSEKEEYPCCKRDLARKSTLFLNARLIVTLQEAVDGPTVSEEHTLVMAYWLVTPKGKRGRAATRCYAWSDVKDLMWKFGSDNLTIKEVWK